MACTRKRRIKAACIALGKPWQSELNESFDGKLRAERHSIEWFRSLGEAVDLAEAWLGTIAKRGLIRASATPTEFRLGAAETLKESTAAGSVRQSLVR